MGSKLTSTNPYLRDPKMRERMVVTSVSSSSAIEGIRAPFKQMSASAGGRTAPNTRVVTKKY
jgi:hypothetical protein